MDDDFFQRRVIFKMWVSDPIEFPQKKRVKTKKKTTSLWNHNYGILIFILNSGTFKVDQHLLILSKEKLPVTK